MKKMLLFLFLSSYTLLSAQQNMHVGIYGGAGTDVNLGLAGGFKISVLPFDYQKSPVEVGAEIFYAHSVEVSDNGYNEYEETTDLLVFGVIANWLINYSLDNPGFYYILGAGAAGVSVEWVETSETDTSLGEPYGTSGSQQSAEGTTGASIINLGLGYNVGGGVDLRLELPVLFFYNQYGEAATVAPAITLMAGYRF